MTLPEAVDSITNEPWFYQWLTNCLTCGPDWFYEGENITEIILDSFQWDLTAEGQNFWDTIQKNHKRYITAIYNEEFTAYLQQRFPSDKFPEIYI